MSKIACRACGSMILPETAQRTASLCLPCARFAERMERGPSGQAYRVAAYLLFVSAGVSLGVLLLSILQRDGRVAFPICVLPAAAIDVFLGRLLLQSDPVARVLVVVRVALGLLVGSLLVASQLSGVGLGVALFSLLAISGSLLLLLGPRGDPTRTWVAAGIGGAALALAAVGLGVGFLSLALPGLFTIA